MNSSSLFFIVAILAGTSADLLDNLQCNRTYFIHGVTLCQRIALDRLARSKGITCDSVYQKQVSCIDDHVYKCLEGTFYVMFKKAIVDLLKIITLNCGNTNQKVNMFLFQQLGCKDGTENKFQLAMKCWSDFVTKYKTNRNDPDLCKSLDDAKECLTNTTNHYCPVINLEPDSYNPFCTNCTDDHRKCPALSISLTCKHDFYYKKEKECERLFIDALANKTSTSSSCSTEVPKLKSCIKKHYSEKCFNPLVDDHLLENLTNGVLSVTKGQRMFCNAVTVTDHSAVLRDITPCETGPDFNEKAEDCVKEFREKFLTNRNDSSLCSVYAEAKSCYHKLQANHCQFSPSILQITNDTYNPFCDAQSLVSCGWNMYFSWSALVSSVFLVLIVSYNCETYQ